VPTEDYIVPIGKAKVKREGTDVTIVTWSGDVKLALAAAQTLAARGISAEVVDLRTLVPLDEATILASVKKTGRLIIAHEACKTGGFGGEIAAVVAEKGFTDLKAPIVRVASKDSPIPQARALARAILMNENDIVAAAVGLVR